MWKYNETLHLSEAEIAEIEAATKRIVPLIETISVRFTIVERSKTTARQGKYCLLLYSDISSMQATSWRKWTSFSLRTT